MLAKTIVVLEQSGCQLKKAYPEESPVSLVTDALSGESNLLLCTPESGPNLVLAKLPNGLANFTVRNWVAKSTRRTSIGQVELQSGR